MDIDKEFIIKEFEIDCISLSQQRYGCRVFQRLFEVCKNEEVKKIYNEILTNIHLLINDKNMGIILFNILLNQRIKIEVKYSFLF